MAVEWIGCDRTAPLGAGTSWRTTGNGFLVSRGMRTSFAGEERCGRALREDDRGVAAPRSDMPHRGRGGRAGLIKLDGFQGWRAIIVKRSPSSNGNAVADSVSPPPAMRVLPNWSSMLPDMPSSPVMVYQRSGILRNASGDGEQHASLKAQAFRFERINRTPSIGQRSSWP